MAIFLKSHQNNGFNMLLEKLKWIGAGFQPSTLPIILPTKCSVYYQSNVLGLPFPFLKEHWTGNQGSQV